MQQELKNKLSKISENEDEPKAKYLRNVENIEFYKVSKILDKRKIGRKEEYLIRWKGFSDADNSWEQSSILDRTKNLKDMKKINQYY